MSSLSRFVHGLDGGPYGCDGCIKFCDACEDCLCEAWERMTYAGLRVPIEFVKQHPARMYYGLLKESVSVTLDNVFDALEQDGWARVTL